MSLFDCFSHTPVSHRCFYENNTSKAKLFKNLSELTVGTVFVRDAGNERAEVGLLRSRHTALRV